MRIILDIADLLFVKSTLNVLRVLGRCAIGNHAEPTTTLSIDGKNVDGLLNLHSTLKDRRDLSKLHPNAEG